MKRAYVYSILAVLLIAVHSSMAFLSNIHEKMTRVERLAVFGSEDLVPEYEVFSVSLPGARRRRQANDNINLEVQIKGRKIVLDLKPTEGYLATNHTPVWGAVRDERAYQNIRYDPLPTAMSDIGNFTMYHDVENEAAVTVYEDPDEGSIMEGIVTAYYAIRSLPKRLIGELLKGEPHLLETEAWGKRSIISDTEEDKGYFVLSKISPALKDVKNRNLVDAVNLQREKRAKHQARKRKVLNAVYPEILIVLDATAMSEHTPTEVLRFTLAFWNGVDLIYRALHKPKVYLNIAGIIVTGNTSTTPYVHNDVFSIFSVLADRVTSDMGKYFYNEIVRFPMNRYDMIIEMTTIGLFTTSSVDGESTSIELFTMSSVDGYNAPYTRACSSTREASKAKIIESTGIVHYFWQFNGVRTAAQITANLLGADSDVIDAADTDCAAEEGYIMSESFNIDNQKMQWSICSRSDFSVYFSSKESECLRNKPLWTKQVGNVLPGRWLTVDGQCQNYGYAKACKLKKLSTCAAMGCQRKESSECVQTERAPLPGSKCGTHMHCSTKKKCVRD